jgi:uncharacterized protein (DUF983 family)
MTVQHRSSRYAKHVCPDCDAGLVWTAYTEPAPRPGTNGCEARMILEAVERGDHLTEKKP